MASMIHSPDSAVLASIIMDGCIEQRYGILSRVAGQLKPSDFSTLRHREIFAAMLELQSRGDPVDLVTLSDHLQAIGKLDTIGGATYLASLTDGEYSLGFVEYYTRKVKQQAARREIQSAIAESASAMKAGGNTADVVEAIRERIKAPLDVLEGDDPDAGTQTMRQIAARAFAGLERVQEGADNGELFTGYDDIDVLYAPRPGNLVVIGARTGVGKTALALGIAENMVKRGDPIYFVSREMPMVDLAHRLMSHIADVNLARFGRKGGLGTEEWNRVSVAVNRIYSLPFYCSRHGRPAEIVSVAQQLMKSSEPIKAVFIDYLGLLDLPRADRHDLRLEAAVNAFAELAKSTGLVVYLLSQINRQAEGGNTRPRKDQLKGSGSIEQAADLIYLLMRPGQYKGDDDVLELAVAKHRQGPTTGGRPIRLAWRRGHVEKGGV